MRRAAVTSCEPSNVPDVLLAEGLILLAILLTIVGILYTTRKHARRN